MDYGDHNPDAWIDSALMECYEMREVIEDCLGSEDIEEYEQNFED